MNRSFWVTLIVSAAVGIIAVLAQAAKTRSLAQQLADEQAKQTISRKSREDPVRESRDTGSSREKVERALARVIELQPNVLEISPVLAKENLSPEDELKIDFRGIESAYARIFPDFLRRVEGLNAEELIAVAKGLPADKTEGWLGKPSSRKWLLLLAAERDPLRIYRDEALMAELAASNVLEIFGRADPVAALRRLPPMKKQTGMPDSSGRWIASILGDVDLGVRIRAATRLLGTDPERALQVFSEVHDNYGQVPPGMSRPLGSTRLPPGAIPGLLDAMQRPEYAEMRDGIIEMVLMDTLFEGGVELAAERVEEMELTGDELNAAIDEMISNEVMEAEPGQMIDWMSELRPDRIPSMVSKWAELDVAAACRWLEQQAPSRIRDESISKLTTRTDELDPESAANWVMEIQDDETRVKALIKVVERWRSEDGSTAAGIWLKERNLSL